MTYVKVGYDELTDEQKQDKKFVSDRYYNLYSDPDGDGYADVLATKKYKTESVAFLTYCCISPCSRS